MDANQKSERSILSRSAAPRHNTRCEVQPNSEALPSSQAHRAYSNKAGAVEMDLARRYGGLCASLTARQCGSVPWFG